MDIPSIIFIVSAVIAGILIYLDRRKIKQERRRLTMRENLEEERKQGGDRRRKWIAQQAKDEARRLKHARRYHAAKQKSQ